MTVNYKKRFRQFTLKETLENALFSDEDVDEMLQKRPPKTQRFLGRYLRDDIERALSHYGILEEVHALGYENLELELGKSGEHDRVTVRGDKNDAQHMLFELVARVSESHFSGQELKTLFVNWLTLRDPVRAFSEARKKLPGQDVPGLGLAREATTLMGRIAERLGLDAVQHRPAYFHVAYVGRRRYVFANPKRQGRFLAMLRDLRAEISNDLAALSPAIDEERVMIERNDGHERENAAKPYQWEASDLLWCIKPDERHDPRRKDIVLAEKDATRFFLKS